jgi:hypothetical protein
LSSNQFSKLVSGIKNKKIRVVSWQGTILMDLLEYAKDLVARGQTNHNAHVVQLQGIVKEQPKEIKTENKPKTTDNQPTSAKNPNSNTYLLIGGLILFGMAILAIGYWIGKKKARPILKTN